MTLLNTSENRKRYYEMTPLCVEYEHQFGKINYHQNLIDLKPRLLRYRFETLDNKYERIVTAHTAHRTLLAHILQNKWKNIKVDEKFGKQIRIKMDTEREITRGKNENNHHFYLVSFIFICTLRGTFQ